jgi:hypothetical protein
MIEVGAPSGSPAIQQHLQQWSLLIVQGKILNKLRGYLEIQPRVDLNDGTLDRILVRPALSMGLGKGVTLWAGYAAVGSTGANSSWEHRAWQQVQHEHDFGGVIVVNRTRFEERFLPGEDQVGLRIRHMLRSVIPVDDKRVWAVVFSDEIFFNLNSPSSSMAAGFDQNRAFAGISWNVTPEFRLEFGYLNNYVDRPSGVDRMNHVPLLVVNYTF